MQSVVISVLMLLLSSPLLVVNGAVCKPGLNYCRLTLFAMGYENSKLEDVLGDGTRQILKTSFTFAEAEMMVLSHLSIIVTSASIAALSLAMDANLSSFNNIHQTLFRLKNSINKN
jgi:hypothetical protein